MAEPKTAPTRAGVKKFVDGIENEARRRDARAVLQLMKDVTGETPRMWGDKIVGFGKYRYRYASGREGEWFLTGFSPTKTGLTLYIMGGFTGRKGLLGKLGKHRTGKGCLYLNRLEQVDAGVLRKLVKESVARLRER